MKVEEFAEQIKLALGDGLVTFSIYGSAATGEKDSSYSDINTLIVTKDLSMATLDKLAGAMTKWGKSRQPAPTLFTLDRLRRSVDVFPIEIHDIKERHRVLIGEDVLATLVPDDQHLRFQVEHELKGKLIQLRDAYLLTGAKSKRIGELLVKSVSTFQLLFRAALRLYAGDEECTKLEAPEKLSKHIEFDSKALEEAQSLKDDPKLIKKIDCRPLFERVLKAVEAVADSVDGKGN